MEEIKEIGHHQVHTVHITRMLVNKIKLFLIEHPFIVILAYSVQYLGLT